MSLVYSQGKEFHIDLAKGEVGRYAILPGDPGRCEKIAQYLENPRKIAQNREYVTYVGELMGERVAVTSTGIGGPSASIAMEELIHCGVDTFIRVGTSGGMQPEVCGGDLVIATGAVRAEGTTREYAPIEYPAVAHYEVVKALERAAQEMQAKYHVGVVQCKDNFYGQHSPETMPCHTWLTDRWEAWKVCGALASEMESAALFITAAVRRVRMGTVLLVLANQTRREMGLPDVAVYDTDLAVKTAVSGIGQLIQADKNKK